MNWIQGPNRAFGVGELKSQNAVIKVYTATQIKNALTQIYKLPSGTGTIQICGDITLTSPIILKQFLADDQGPKEIIIEAIGGAKILNGRPTTTSAITYENVVFDMGETQPLGAEYQNTCKYTFRNLNINSAEGQFFYGFLKWDSYNKRGGAAVNCYAGPVSLINFKCTKLMHIYLVDGATIPARDYLQSSSIDGFIIDNETTSPAFNTCLINNATLVCLSNYFSNFTTSNYSNLFFTSLGFYSQGDADPESSGNVFVNIVIRFNIFPSVTAANSYGRGTLIGCRALIEAPRAGGWNIDNTSMKGTENPSGVPYADGIRTQFAAGNLEADETYINGVDLVGFPQDTNNQATIEHTHVFNSEGNLLVLVEEIRTPTLPTDSRYIVDWKISAIKVATNEVNSYNMQTTVKNVGGVVTILDNTTIYAYEEVPGQVFGLNPAIVANKVYIAPYGLDNFKFDGSYKITGYNQL